MRLLRNRTVASVLLLTCFIASPHAEKADQDKPIIIAGSDLNHLSYIIGLMIGTAIPCLSIVSIPVISASLWL